MPLQAGPVSAFYAEFMSQLDALGLGTPVWSMPVEIPDAIPFTDDDQHTAYDPEQAQRFWLALTRMVPVFERFRSGFVGKASPVHLFWGGLDLATTRFSGRTAPPHPGGAPNCGPHVMLEAYSHEVSSCGYWPDGATEGLLYSYAYPTPPGYPDRSVNHRTHHGTTSSASSCCPRGGAHGTESGRGADDLPEQHVQAAATTANWDRKRLER